MSDFKVFHKSIKGASHISSGKPCQDYSASFDVDGVQIAVVCDGHGGSTYVRSDIGARIAVETAIDCLKNFVRCISDEVFVGTSFSITAKPKHNPFVDVDGRKLRFEDMNDSQKQWAKQAESYCESEEKNIEQQRIVKDLLNQIYNAWVKAISSDAKKHSFNKKEQAALKDSDISKAYGCTLLAYLRTPRYWLAFQIGDGSIYCCDEKLVWQKPVPDDYSCFLNYTTSLCDSNPIPEFRYAFNGEGVSPVAVMLSSDGVEGSLRTKENIEDFYEQIIGLCLDGDNVDEELQSYLPKLSEDGSRDDVSVAGMVDLSMIDITDIKKRMTVKRRSRAIRTEYRDKKSEIDGIDSRIDTLKIKLDRQKDIRFMKQTELDELREDLKVKEKNMEDLGRSIEEIKKEIAELRESLKVKKTELEAWKNDSKNEMAELEAGLKEDENENNKDNQINKNSISNW